MSLGHTIRCYEYVNKPFAQVQGALRCDAAGIFARATTKATARVVAVQLHARVGPLDVATEVKVEVGAALDTLSSAYGYDVTVFPLAWRAVHTPNLFPRMKGKLSVFPISRDVTQLELEGTYDPPLGLIGDALDALAGHRVAEASVLQFLREVAGRLTAELGAEVQPTAAAL